MPSPNNQLVPRLPLAETGTITNLAQSLVLYRMIGIAQMKQRTRVEYEHDLADLVAYLERGGIQEADKVTLAHLKIYLADLERRGYKPSTRNRKAFVIKGFFRFLREVAITSRNVAAGLIPPQVERGEPRFLSQAEYARLLQAASVNVRDAAIIELFLQTGIRLSELVGLTMRDVTLEMPDSATIRIRRGGRHAAIPINHKAQNALRKWLAVREPIQDTALFLTAVKKPMGKRAVQLMLEKYLKEAEIPHASVQTLRHTMAVHHLAKGTPLKTLADILSNHPDTVQAYVTAARKVHSRALQDHAL